MTKHAFFTPWGDLTDVPQVGDWQAAANDNAPESSIILPHGTPHNAARDEDNYPDVVAFTGQAGAGKSTATRFLVDELGYTLVKFAGPLKDMMRAIGLGEDQIEGEFKETPTVYLCGHSPRHAMQALGTEWGRKCIGDDFWVGIWASRVATVLKQGGRVVVDDCRFANEAAAIRKLGGDILEIVGRGGIAGGHESERGCGDRDAVVVNDGTLEDLAVRVKEALERYG